MTEIEGYVVKKAKQIKGIALFDMERSKNYLTAQVADNFFVIGCFEFTDGQSMGITYLSAETAKKLGEFLTSEADKLLAVGQEETV